MSSTLVWESIFLVLVIAALFQPWLWVGVLIVGWRLLTGAPSQP